MPRSQDDLNEQLKIYTAKLTPFGAKAVAAACDEWAMTQSEWPSLAKLVALCREHVKLEQPALPPPGPETFFARCDRLGIGDLGQIGMGRYGALLREHDMGRLTDENLAAGVEMIRAGRDWAPRLPEADRDRVIDMVARMRRVGAA